MGKGDDERDEKEKEDEAARNIEMWKIKRIIKLFKVIPIL